MTIEKRKKPGDPKIQDKYTRRNAIIAAAQKLHKEGRLKQVFYDPNGEPAGIVWK